MFFTEGIVEPVPGEIFDKDGRNLGVFGYFNTHWTNITDNERHIFTFFCQAIDIGLTKGHQGMELGTGCFDVYMECIGLDKADVGFLFVVLKMLEGLAKDRLRDRSKNMANDRSYSGQTVENSRHSGGMAITVRCYKTTDLIHGRSFVVVMRVVAIGVYMTMLMYVAAFASMDVSVVKGVEGRCCFCKKIPIM